MPAGKAAVQQLHPIEIGEIGDAVDLRSHCLVFGFDHQALYGVIGAGRRLLGQLLHADQLFVDDLQGPVRDLVQGHGVAGIARPLPERLDVRPHELPDGQSGGIVRGPLHAQAAGEAADGIVQSAVMRPQLTRNAVGHHIMIGRKCAHPVPPSPSDPAGCPCGKKTPPGLP